MSNNDTILIKIGVSYREGISAEELYRVTSESWVISESNLKSGDYKYYCPIYNNTIKEVYYLEGYEKDDKRKGRFILKGTLAKESIRNKLIGLDLGEIHKGKGNPIKYYSVDELLKRTNDIGINSSSEITKYDSEIKKILEGLAKHTNEIRTLSTQNSNWITNVTDEEICVETIPSREKYSKGEKDQPYDKISFEYILEAWNEFVSNKKASSNHFVKTRGRSSFFMAFFKELPFVEKSHEDGTVYIKLDEYTTDQLPEASLNQVLSLLNEIISENLDPKLISQKYTEDSGRRLKLRARQSLKILGFLSDQYEINQGIVNEFRKFNNKNDYLKYRMMQHPYLKMIADLLIYLNSYKRNVKLSLLTKVGMLVVQNSKDVNQMVESVSEYRTRNILNWFKEVGIVDEEWNLVDKEITAEYSPSSNSSQVHDELVKDLSMNEIVEHVDQYIGSKGFYYEAQEIQNLYLSLRTKPFVILSGISGTGKTMIIKWFAESIGATEKNGQFTIIPVRPDWSDGSDLLGYVDIAGKFKEGLLTTVIKNAIQNSERPYFVLLDEMNLARVEYYFSDILSVMESRESKDNKIITSSLLKNEKLDNPVYFPDNLFIIGTVNMDETTYPFSKKVLDRATTIEFNEVRLDYLEFLRDIPEIKPIALHNYNFVSRYIHLKDVFNIYSDIVSKGTEELVKINSILKQLGAHVGYRVRDEICFYLAYNEEGKLMTFEHAIDRCILQKILPRISGSDTRVERTLKQLFRLFTNKELDDNTVLPDTEEMKYPKSAAKVFEMYRRLSDDSFTSFWIS
ncbi:hypothetical protein [Bacillus sp. FJAT-45066]|uniref:hypothetical protein n=1 Tax=Bacillus sp. FJAT-45066 TaxID=2011010 RepID=UPI000BB7A92F|nr:hypothetical protein [Bacillus sp. FJAT-45066]